MNAKTFWNRIKALIKEKKITQETVAKACKIHINTWRGWGSKNIVPGLFDCYRIAKYLGVSVDYLISGKELDAQAKIAEIQSLLDKANDKLKRLK